MVPLMRDEEGDRRHLFDPSGTGFQALGKADWRCSKTFADQAVIAIENVRLFREIQDKSRQLEIANQHKSDFLANMSHELRTPLNAIIGFSEVLVEKMFGEVNDKQLDYLKDIHSSGKHLLSLINDILDLSKIEAGRMELDIAEFDLRSALRERDDAGARARPAPRHRARAWRSTRRSAQFRADERKFKQIMLNLLSNAVKFTPDGGKVGVAREARTATPSRSRSRTPGVGIAAGGPGDRVRGIQAGRQRLHAEGRGHRPRPRAHQALRRAARRHDPARERARQGLDLHRSPFPHRP